MSQTWFNEYRRLTINTNALERECSKLKDILGRQCPEEKSLSSRTRSNLKLNNNMMFTKSNTLSSKSTSRHCMSLESDKEILMKKICFIHEQCAVIKDALVTVLDLKAKQGENGNINKLKRAKNVCKKAITDYEFYYDSLRTTCDDEIETLKNKSHELYQNISCMLKMDGFEKLNITF